MMYFDVRCRLVTTPPSCVMFLVMFRPPVRHAASTKYRCLKCDLYDLGLGRVVVLSKLRDADIATGPGEREAEKLGVPKSLSDTLRGKAPGLVMGKDATEG